MLKNIIKILLIITASYNFTLTQSIVDSVKADFKPNVKPLLNISKTANDVIKIDGIIEEKEWSTASLADNFSDVSSGKNIKPQVDTKAYITYDDENLYLGFICWDDMSTLRVSMTDRDRMFSDDWVGIFFNTYNDIKQAFEFYTNAYGVQGDLVWSTNYEDSSPNYIYDSEAKIYNDKWTAEIRIPFKSLNFPNVKEQTWRVHLLRNRPREHRQEIYWASINRDDPSFLGQSGIWKGIKNIKKGRDLEILPYIVGSINANNKDIDITSSKLTYDKPEFDAGLNLKYGLSTSLTWDLTFNPDFSQVEADAPQIDVNSSSAIFFSEKRPFFLEGNYSFITPTRMLHTRMIVNPIVATKLTGKLKKLNIGVLSAYDENTPFLVPYKYGSFALSSNKNSISNIVRLKYDLGHEDYIGLTISDREQSNDSNKTFSFDGYNRVFAFDGKYGLTKNLFMGFQIFHHMTKEINDTSLFKSGIKFGKDNQYDLAFNGESFNGQGALIFLERFTRTISFYTEYSYQSPYSRKDNGFTGNNDYQYITVSSDYNIYPESKLIRRINPMINGGIKHSSNGKPMEQWLQPQFIFSLNNGLSFIGNYLLVNNEEYKGIMHRNINRGMIELSYNFKNIISGLINYEIGKYIVRFRNPSFIGNGQNIYIKLTLKPVDRLNISADYNYSDLFEENGSTLYRGYVISVNSDFVFNRHFFLRMQLQYDEFDKVLNVDPLLSYKWNPFTIFYIGSTHHFNNENNYKEAERKIFAKFQYLLSL